MLHQGLEWQPFCFECKKFLGIHNKCVMIYLWEKKDARFDIAENANNVKGIDEAEAGSTVRQPVEG